jgi:polysaccharide biosynthesis protein PslG
VTQPLLAVLVVALLLGAAPAAAAERVPARFFGVVAEPDLLHDRALGPVGTTLENEVAAMSGAGVGSIRASFFWARIQPYRTWDEIPEAGRGDFTDVGGRPYAFGETDRLVAAAAARRIGVLPVLLWAPAWAAKYRNEFASPPKDPKQYGEFAAVLAARYGPTGDFWREHPELPRMAIRDWQVWNEPTMLGFWLDQPFAKAYVKLLQAARPALRRVDSRARVVLAGLVYDSPRALRAIYGAGGRKHFDVVGLHPFTLQVRNVAALIEQAREVMRDHGDARKPALVTELSWPSARGKVPRQYGYEMDEKGQAARVRSALPYLAARRRALRIERIYWYSWLTREVDPEYPFDYAGLRRLEDDRVVAKPAFAAFSRTARELQGLRARP